MTAQAMPNAAEPPVHRMAASENLSRGDSGRLRGLRRVDKRASESVGSNFRSTFFGDGIALARAVGRVLWKTRASLPPTPSRRRVSAAAREPAPTCFPPAEVSDLVAL